MQPEWLSLWTVYDHPKDFPHGYIARRWEVTPAGATPTGDIITNPSLELMRVMMEAQGLSCLPRQEDDDPAVLESWL